MPKTVKSGVRPAFAYLCHDAVEEQRRAIYAYAAVAGFEIVREFEEFGDGAAPGCAVGPGFLTLLRSVGRRGIRTIIVDTAAHFSPDRTSQAVACLRLRERGVDLIAADSTLNFASENSEAASVRQVLDVVGQIDGRFGPVLVQKARKRVLNTGNEPWRKTYAEFVPKATVLARQLHEDSRKKGARMSLREISAELALAGHLNSDGKPFHPEAIRRMINGAAPRRNGSE